MKHTPKFALQIGSVAANATDQLKTETILGLPLVNASPERAISTLLSPGRRQVFFLNAHCAKLRARNARYARALSQADYILPDGIGIDIAARMQGKTLEANLNGTDLVPSLLDRAATKGLSVFLLGARPGTAEAAAATLCQKIPGLMIAGTRDGYEGAQDAPRAVADINASGADIVLVAMGAPAQELWIAQNFRKLTARLVMGVGALFDFLAGKVRRAPLKIRKMRLEWAWRLALEPKRLARRYLIGNFTFLTRAAKYAVIHSDPTAAIKRTIDVALAGTALVILSPLLVLVAALVRLETSGPAIFKQVRVGKDGRPFDIYKFRSMHNAAEKQRAALLDSSDRKGVCFKVKSDPRITRVGKYLRRWSLDELPQIINVLKGEMSIVGPRPALPEEVAVYPVRALTRLQVKPGITGVWQVSGRADVGFDKMLDLDLAYVRARSILLDILVIALTFRAVFSSRGAY